MKAEEAAPSSSVLVAGEGSLGGERGAPARGDGSARATRKVRAPPPPSRSGSRSGKRARPAVNDDVVVLEPEDLTHPCASWRAQDPERASRSSENGARAASPLCRTLDLQVCLAVVHPFLRRHRFSPYFPGQVVVIGVVL